MSVRHHLSVFANAWSAETKRRKGNAGEWDNVDFLPAALEVAESPPSPVGRWTLWLIALIVVVVVIWASVSRVEMVSVAEGRLVPSGRLRTVEAAQQGVIRAIKVREGEHVTGGQALIELDPTVADAEADSARVDFSTASLTRARDNALLAYSAGQRPKFDAPRGASPLAIEAEHRLVQARIEAYQDTLISLNQKQAGAKATERASEAEIVKLQRTLPMLKEALSLQEDLDRQGFGARQKLLQQQQAYVTAQEDLNAQFAKRDEAAAQVSSLAADAAQAKADFIGNSAKERAEAESVVATKGDAVKAADQRKGLQVLTAPVSGTVQEITVTNIGEVPEVGKPLVTIVPDGEPLVVEALLLNQDAGFVRKGMPAVIKLEAYPFTRYGVLRATVEHVSPDATVDQKRGLVFPVRLTVNDPRLIVDGKLAPLSPGMSLQAEIVTGSRRVIEFLWSPISKTIRQAGREH